MVLKSINPFLWGLVISAGLVQEGKAGHKVVYGLLLGSWRKMMFINLEKAEN